RVKKAGFVYDAGGSAEENGRRKSARVYLASALYAHAALAGGHGRYKGQARGRTEELQFTFGESQNVNQEIWIRGRDQAGQAARIMASPGIGAAFTGRNALLDPTDAVWTPQWTPHGPIGGGRQRASIEARLRRGAVARRGELRIGPGNARGCVP